jgi:hypothetical protein
LHNHTFIVREEWLICWPGRDGDCLSDLELKSLDDVGYDFAESSTQLHLTNGMGGVNPHMASDEITIPRSSIVIPALTLHSYNKGTRSASTTGINKSFLSIHPAYSTGKKYEQNRSSNAIPRHAGFPDA